MAHDLAVAAKFTRQLLIGPYVADFYCPAAKMVVEVDGATHDFTQDVDCKRDAYMRSLGLKIVRIAAADVLTDPNAVADGIYRLRESSVAGPSTTQPGG